MEHIEVELKILGRLRADSFEQGTFNTFNACPASKTHAPLGACVRRALCACLRGCVTSNERSTQVKDAMVFNAALAMLAIDQRHPLI